MRILHLTWGLGVGGLESMLTDIASAQAQEHEVWLLVGNSGVASSLREDIDPRVRLVELGRPPGSRNPLHLLRLAWSIRRIRPHLIHSHHESFGRLRGLLRLPMLYTVHNTREPLAPVVHAYDGVACISEAVRGDVLARLAGCEPFVVRNGVRFDAIRRKHHYGSEALRIVQVGRLQHEQKGQDILIRAIGLLKSRRIQLEVSVDFIGEGSSLAWLKAMALECGVPGQCSFRGRMGRSDLYAQLADYDLLVQPSRFEGFGLTVVEGMAAGLPVLVADIEGPREIVREGALGWTFSSEDPESLAQAILEQYELSRQPGFGERMQQRVAEARSHYDVRRTAAEYLVEYQRVLAKARSQPAAQASWR
jgi:glycosyltransferase involved in cell wall biosynthesis